MLKEKASVSVIIPCYRCVNTIERAVLSVINQSLPVLQIILVDDASDDGTYVFLKKLKARYSNVNIDVLSCDINSGPSKARNLGWEYARGDYIAFLDADDSWCDQKIEIQYGWLKNNPAVDLIAHDVDVRLNDECDLSERKNVVFPLLIKTSALLLSNRFSTPTVMLKRSIKLRFNEYMKHSEDYDLWLRIILTGGVIYKFPVALGFLYKDRYGKSGLSADLLAMEMGELNMYRQLFLSKLIGWQVLPLLCWSIMKFIRRILIVKVIKKRQYE